MKSLSFSIFLINILLLFQLIATQGINQCQIYNSIVNGTVSDCCNLKEGDKITVKCDEYGRIYYLDLMNKSLKTLSPEISKLTSLVYLDLENNQLTNLPNEMTSLLNLKYLYLINNQFQNVPQIIPYFRFIEELDLSSNQITNIPDEIYNMKSLKTLILDHNNLGSISSSIGNLIQLEQLYLSDTGLNDLPEEVFNLRYLRRLIISKNNLSSISSRLFNLNYLDHLYIYDNPKLAIKLINFNNSTIEYCDLHNTNIICKQENTCRQLENTDLSGIRNCSLKEIEEVRLEAKGSESKSSFGYIIIFSVLGVLLIILLILSCIVVKNIVSEKKSREIEVSNHQSTSNTHQSHHTSSSQPQIPNDYRYSNNAYKNYNHPNSRV